MKRTKKFLERELERYRYDLANAHRDRERAEFLLGEVLTNTRRTIRQLEHAEPMSEELLAMRTAAADLAYICSRVDENRYPDGRVT